MCTQDLYLIKLLFIVYFDLRCVFVKCQFVCINRQSHTNRCALRAHAALLCSEPLCSTVLCCSLFIEMAIFTFHLRCAVQCTYCTNAHIYFAILFLWKRQAHHLVECIETIKKGKEIQTVKMERM